MGPGFGPCPVVAARVPCGCRAQPQVLPPGMGTGVGCGVARFEMGSWPGTTPYSTHPAPGLIPFGLRHHFLGFLLGRIYHV